MYPGERAKLRRLQCVQLARSAIAGQAAQRRRDVRASPAAPTRPPSLCLSLPHSGPCAAASPPCIPSLRCPVPAPSHPHTRTPPHRASRTAHHRVPLPPGTADGRSSRWRPTSPSRALASAATSASWRSCGRNTSGGVRSHAKTCGRTPGAPTYGLSRLPASHLRACCALFLSIHPSTHPSIPSIHLQAAARRPSKWPSWCGSAREIDP